MPTTETGRTWLRFTRRRSLKDSSLLLCDFRKKLPWRVFDLFSAADFESCSVGETCLILRLLFSETGKLSTLSRLSAWLNNSKREVMSGCYECSQQNFRVNRHWQNQQRSLSKCMREKWLSSQMSSSFEQSSSSSSRTDIKLNFHMKSILKSMIQ